MKQLSDKKRHRVREHFYINSRCCAKLAAVALTAGLTLAGGLTAQGWGIERDIDFNDDNGIGTIQKMADYTSIYGWYKTGEGETAEDGNITVAGRASTVYDLYICGGCSTNGNAKNNTVTYQGIDSKQDKVSIRGGFGQGENVLVSGNKIIMMDDSTADSGVGGSITGSGVVKDNHVDIMGGFHTAYGGALYAKDDIGKGDKVVTDNTVTVWGSVRYAAGGSISGYNSDGKAVVRDNVLHIKAGGRVTESAIGGLNADYNNADIDIINNTVYVSSDSHVNGQLEYSLEGLYGGCSFGKGGTVSGNHVFIYEENGRSLYTGVDGLDVYAGYSESGTVSNNTITLYGTFSLMGDTRLHGSNQSAAKTTGNALVADGWSGSFSSAENFNLISFRNTKWAADSNVMNIQDGVLNALEHTQVKLENFVIDRNTVVNPGDSMTIIKSNVDTGLSMDNVESSAVFSQGVAKLGTGELSLTGATNNLVYTVTGFSRNPQVDVIASNRAVAAAFVNQGTDLVSDSLDTLSHDGRYGTKTFAAVYGNRSKYDVNSDLKINGWSTIVGVGNTHKVKDGDLSWGVFYENGTGNYRTYNSFNNEFFRGDGSLLYNGGGAAVRYNRDNGWYYEGSLRAGTLKSDMDNALMDGDGNHYGCSSESNYYGAHIGVGKVFSLSADRELDVYGKFFHTYTDGDSFDVAGDRFEFDDITSDRLRIGARIRTNPEERVSTYYGLAYEYEFNGDADMRAAGLDAPTQSLQGSTCMAELGLKYQPSETSPWNFDLNVRGYAGEREGGSFHAQVSYLF